MALGPSRGLICAALLSVVTMAALATPITEVKARSVAPGVSPPAALASEADADLVAIHLPLHLRHAEPVRHEVFLSRADQYGGSSHALDAADGLAYLGVGPRMVVVDVSDPLVQRQIGQTGPLGSLVWDIAVDGDTAFVLSESGWRSQPLERHASVYVVDVSSPSAPVVRGRHDLGAPGHSIDSSGHRAFAVIRSTFRTGLVEIDASDVDRPIESSFTPLDMDRPRYDEPVGGVSAVGDVVYVHAPRCVYERSRVCRAVLSVIDAANHGAPQLAAELADLPEVGVPSGLSIDGNRAYLGGSDGVVLLDVSRPLAPQLLGPLDWWETLHVTEMVVVGDHVAVVEEGCLVSLFDRVASVDPPDPSPRTEAVGTVQLCDRVALARSLPNNAIASLGQHVVVPRGTSSGGLQLVDATTPEQPTAGDPYDAGESASCVATLGDHAYATDFRTLEVFDTSDRLHPRRIAGSESVGSADDIVVAGETLYTLNHMGYLQVVDLSVRDAPTLLGTARASRRHARLAVADGFAFAYGYLGLEAFDVRDPTAPRTVSLHADAGGVRVGGIGLSTGIAYLAAGRDGLRVFDVSNPADVTEIGRLDTRGEAAEVLAAGGVAYVAINTRLDSRAHSELVAVDISDPTSPRELDSLGVPGNVAGRLQRADELLLATTDRNVLEIVDVSQPERLRHVGRSYQPVDGSHSFGCGQNLVVGQGYVYRAAGSGGLQSLRVTDVRRR